MRKALLVSCALQAAVVSIANAGGPFGTIHVGNWIGGAFSDDSTGKFSHCAATSSYGSGVSLVVGQTATNSRLLSFASPAFKFNKGETIQIDVIFDGQEQARLFATANNNIMITAIMLPRKTRSATPTVA